MQSAALLCISLLTSCIPPIEGGALPDAKPIVADATTTTDGTTTPNDEFARWMKCMTLSDFRAAKMTAEWNKLLATGNTECRTCHENGGEGFIVSANEQKFFGVVSTNRYYALQFFTYEAFAATFDVTSNDIAMNGVSTGQDPHREHPRFNPTLGLAASRDFADRTQARYDAAAGNCP
jgi:hypothetical protein